MPTATELKKQTIRNLIARNKRSAKKYYSDYKKAGGTVTFAKLKKTAKDYN